MTPATLDHRSGAESAIRTYCANRGAEDGSSPLNCGVYFYELITFGPVLSIEYQRSADQLHVGDEVSHRGRQWRVDRIEPSPDAGATRLICLDANLQVGSVS